MHIETQFSDCGCALMRQDNGSLVIQPGLACTKKHDWALIIAGIKSDIHPLFKAIAIDELQEPCTCEWCVDPAEEG